MYVELEVYSNKSFGNKLLVCKILVGSVCIIVLQCKVNLCAINKIVPSYNSLWWVVLSKANQLSKILKLVQMVSTRRGNRNTQDSGPGEGQGDGAESRNRTLVGQTDRNARGSIVFDDATMEALRNMMLQTIQSVLPTV